MIIITGEPRSGTSLMMETVRLLGFEVWGEEQPGESRREATRDKEGREETLTERLQREKAHWMNEKFWEIGGLVMRGIHPRVVNQLEQAKKAQAKEKGEEYDPSGYEEVINEHKDHAVKVIWNGLMQTDRDILENSKIILCLRNPIHIAQSQTHLQGHVQMASNIEGEDEVAFISPPNPISAMRYLRTASNFVHWLSRPMNKNLEILRVDYDDMIFNTEETVKRIVGFLGNCLEDNIQMAVMNVDTDRRRSAIPKVPEEGDPEEWELVQDIYDFLRNDAFTEEAVANRVREYEESRRNNPENRAWVCGECFWPMTVPLWRDYLSQEKLRTNMLKSTERRRDARMLCTQCPLYKQSEEVQEIELPYDLDNIVRPKVDCPAMGVVTLDACHNHYKQVKGDTNFFNKYVNG